MDDPIKAEGEQIFAFCCIPAVCNHRYLDGFLCKSAGWDAFAQVKVHQWVADVQSLTNYKMADKQPHAAFFALLKSLHLHYQENSVKAGCSAKPRHP